MDRHHFQWLTVGGPPATQSSFFGDLSLTKQRSSRDNESYVTKLENKLSALEHQLNLSEAEVERLRIDRDIAEKRLSSSIEKCAEASKKYDTLKAANASRNLYTALNQAQLVVHQCVADAWDEAVVREESASDEKARNLLIEELKQKASAAQERNATLESQLKKELEEKVEMRTAILNHNTEREILQSIIMRYKNIFRDFATTAVKNNRESEHLGSLLKCKGEAGDEAAKSPMLECAGTEVGARCALGLEESYEKLTTTDCERSNSECLDEEEVLPAAFWDAVGMISPEELAELEALGPLMGLE